MANITINDVAKLAGVSAASVSRYLNDGYLSEKKKEAVKAAIEQTGFIPSRQAQGLRSRQTKVIGVVIPKIDSEAISRVVAGITTVLSQNGYELLLGNTDNNIEKELDYLEIFGNNRVDGIIFIATLMTVKHKNLLAKINVPVVVVGQKADYVSSIYHDDYGAAHELTKLLLEKGRTHIGYIGVTNKDKAAGKSRYLGFMAAVKAATMEFDEEKMVCEGPFSMESGYENAGILLKRDPQLQAVFCATDMIAVGAMKLFHENDIKIPEQIAVCGIGDTRMSKVVTPSLATAHYHYKTSGAEAAELLLKQIKNGPELMQSIKLGFEIIKNKSI